jgi:hypothetical protein
VALILPALLKGTGFMLRFGFLLLTLLLGLNGQAEELLQEQAQYCRREIMSLKQHITSGFYFGKVPKGGVCVARVAYTTSDEPELRITMAAFFNNQQDPLFYEFLFSKDTPISIFSSSVQTNRLSLSSATVPTREGGGINIDQVSFSFFENGNVEYLWIFDGDRAIDDRPAATCYIDEYQPFTEPTQGSGTQ